MHRCPKCKHDNARYRDEDGELWEECQCGHLKCVFSSKPGTIRFAALAFEPTNLPRKNSRLEKFYQALIDRYPGSVSTGTLAKELVGGDIKISGYCLNILQHKGLAIRVTNRGTAPGGNDYRITDTVAKFLDIYKHQGSD